MPQRSIADRALHSNNPDKIVDFINQKVVPGKFGWMPRQLAMVKGVNVVEIDSTTPEELGIAVELMPLTRVHCLVQGLFTCITDTADAADSIAVSCVCSPDPINQAEVEAEHPLGSLDEIRQVSGLYQLTLAAGITYTITLYGRLTDGGGLGSVDASKSCIVVTTAQETL